jgi:hypothetical protein
MPGLKRHKTQAVERNRRQGDKKQNLTDPFSMVLLLHYLFPHYAYHHITGSKQ